MQIDRIKKDNHKVFDMISRYLNDASDYIDENEINEIADLGVSYEYAFGVILAAAFDMDIVENEEDKKLFNRYFSKMFHRLDVNEFYYNLYYRNIRIPVMKIGNCELKYEKYKPFEGFVCDDILADAAGVQIPQIGFFETEFVYPAVLEDGRL